MKILKTCGAEILIFDEPTAVLTPQEIHELIQIRCKNLSFLLHIVKNYGSLRSLYSKGGIGTVNVADEHKLAELMVGRQVNFKTEK